MVRKCRTRVVAVSLVFMFILLLYLRDRGIIMDIISRFDNLFRSKKTYDVLIIGYLRGGTTFFGDMVGLRKGSFYIYEPLHKMALFGYFRPGYVCSMMNESCSSNNGTSDEEVLDALRGIYTCDTDRYRYLLDEWQLTKSQGYQKTNLTGWKLPSHECNMTWNDCLEKYLHQCSNRVSKVSKIPRLSISLASKLLDELPNLKIIHLIRDPRAIMNSRDKFSWTPVPGGAVSLCKKIMADYLSSVEVKRAHPGRLYTVFYEEIAGNPIETFRGIYDFLGYQFSKNDQIRLTARTASSKQGNAGSTYRFNSAKTASTWKKQINSTVLKETNKACFSVYQLLGYPEFKGS